METKKTLKELFESRKEELAQKLSNFCLPKDAEIVQQTVTNHLNELFDTNGDFRQNLTQSEDYILQAAMSLLNAQQSIVSELASISKKGPEKAKQEQVHVSDSSSISLKKNAPMIIGGTTVGGAAGALLLGSWGAVFGAIAGTALVLYYTSTQDDAKKTTAQSPTIETVMESKIDVEKYLGFVGSICDSIDSLILTFRAQINRVVDKYENQEKPVLEKEYGVLLDSIQSLIGANYQVIDERWLKRIKSRIEELSESLENYGLEVVCYDESKKGFFDVIISENVSEATMSLPAIVKEGVAVRRGKALINN